MLSSLLLALLSPQAVLSLFSFSTVSHLANALISNFSFGLSYTSSPMTVSSTPSTENSTNEINFESNDVSSVSDSLYSQLGSSSDFRNNPFTNPIISYDYKCGHYLGL